MKITFFLPLLLIVNIVSAQYPFIKHTYPNKFSATHLGDENQFADLNNDGFEDLINTGSGIQLIIPHNGVGLDSMNSMSFGSLGIEAGPIGDWDNDGQLDFFNTYGGLNIAINQGGFSWIPNDFNISEANLSFPSFTDINHDGFIDVYLKKGADSLMLLINQSGNFTPLVYTVAVKYNVGNNRYSKLHDVDNDGIDEIFVRENNNTIYILKDQGGFNYTLQDSIVSNSIGLLWDSSFDFVDMNNDGKKELMISTDRTSGFSNNFHFYVFENTTGYNYVQQYDGNFSFTVTTGYGGTDCTPFSDFYDVDGNGYLDVVIGNSVFFNNGSFTFNEQNIVPTPRMYNGNLQCSDVDGDGNTDICFVYNTFTTHIYQYFARVEVDASQNITSNPPFWHFMGGFYGAVTDYDNDGDYDILSKNEGIASYVVYENENDTLIGGFAGANSLNNELERFYFMDFNNDGFEDFFALSVNSPYGIAYGVNSGTKTYVNGGVFSSNGTATCVGDLTGDGVDEIIVSRIAAGGNGAYLELFSTSTGIPISQGDIHSWSEYASERIVLSISDYDLDGLNDIIIQQENASINRIRLLHNDGGGVFSPGQIMSTGLTAMLGVFDSDGDGYPDLHLHGESDKIWRYTNNSDGTFAYDGVFFTLPTGTFNYTTFGEAFDIDNDGKKDLLIHSSNYHWILMNSGTSLNLSYQGNELFNVTQIKDMDNDGDLDVISNGIWHENINNISFTTIGSVFYDVNSNGTYDSSLDIFIPDFTLSLNNGSYITTSDSLGLFQFPLGNNLGSYNIGMDAQMANWYLPTTIPYPSVANVDSLTPLDSVWLGVENPNGFIDALLDQTLSGHRCNESGRLYINTNNLTPDTVDYVLKVVLAQNTSLLSANNPYTLNGDTVSIVLSNVLPFQNDYYYLDIQMPSTAFMSDTMFFTSSLSIQSGGGQAIRYDTLNQILTCAYDPNDKSLVLSDHLIILDTTYALADEIEYLIRFQNTGNDTAINIRIEDHLAITYLDMSSFEFVSSSHSVSYNLDNLGNLAFDFSNIYLPDSTTDFIGSMGYVKFKVNYNSSVRNLPVNNFARIYFDQNPPILTNTNVFVRTECSHFVNVTMDTVGFCAPDSLLVVNDDFGVGFDYLWIANGDSSFQTDSTNLFVSNSGVNIFTLVLNNSHCSFDTLIGYNVDWETPLVNLNMTDTNVCYGQSINVIADQSCSWSYYNEFNNSWNTYPSLSTNKSFNQVVAKIRAISGTQVGCPDTAYVNVQTINLPFSISNYDMPLGVDVCSDTTFFVEGNYDSISWVATATPLPYAFTADTSRDFPLFFDNDHSSVSLTATVDTLGCEFSSTVVFDVTSPVYAPIINYSYFVSSWVLAAPDYLNICDSMDVVLEVSRPGYWFKDGNYIGSGAVQPFVGEGFYKFVDSLCGGEDSVEIGMYSDFISFEKDTIFVCGISPYTIGFNSNINEIVHWEKVSIFNSIVYSFDQDSISFNTGSLNGHGFNVTASHSSSFCADTTSVVVMVNSQNLSIVNHSGGKHTSDGKKHDWFFSTTSANNYQFIEHSDTLQSIANGYYIITDTLYDCTKVSLSSYLSNPIAYTYVYDTICQGDSVFLEGSFQTDAGVYEDGIGVNSVLQTSLYVQLQQGPISSLVNACEGGVVSFPDGYTVDSLVTSFTHTSVIQSYLGCDSIIETFVNVIMIDSSVSYVQACLNSDYTFPDNYTEFAIQTSMSHYSSIPSSSGCNDVIETVVSINYADSSLYVDSICPNSDYTFPDGHVEYSVVAPLVYYSYLVGVLGCDSIVETNLNIFETDSLGDFANVCRYSDYTFPDGHTEYNISNDFIYISSLGGVNGCDTLIYTTIEVLAMDSIILLDTICLGEDYTFLDGSTQYAIQNSLIHTTGLVNVQGCDSIVELQLFVKTVDVSVNQQNETLNVINNADSYQWLDCENNYTPIVGAVYQSFTAISDGEFAVKVNNFNCLDTSICYAINSTSVKEGNASNFIIYPNPNFGTFNIVFEQEEQEVELNIYNQLGEKLYASYDLNVSLVNIVLDLAKGVYYLKVNVNGIEVVERLVVL